MEEIVTENARRVLKEYGLSDESLDSLNVRFHNFLVEKYRPAYQLFEKALERKIDPAIKFDFHLCDPKDNPLLKIGYDMTVAQNKEAYEIAKIALDNLAESLENILNTRDLSRQHKTE